MNGTLYALKKDRKSHTVVDGKHGESVAILGGLAADCP